MKLTPLDWKNFPEQCCRLRAPNTDVAVKWRLKLRKCFVSKSCAPQNLSPLFNGVIEGGATKMPRTQIKGREQSFPVLTFFEQISLGTT